MNKHILKKSYCIKTKEQALALTRKYNQVSIWDNENQMEIKIPYYEKGNDV